MRNIFTSIDIGTYEIKVVTVEYYNGKYNVLASASVSSSGVRKGLITDALEVSNAIKKAMKQIESKLGTKVDKVLALIPANHLELHVTNGKVTFKEEHEINGEDIFSCMQNSLKKEIQSGMEIVGVYPVEYKIGEDQVVDVPLGVLASSLSMKCVVASVPKKNVYSVVSILEGLNIEVMDIGLSGVSDYAVIRGKELDLKVSAIVNIGDEKTNISVFNKGILISDAVLPFGSKNIDYDIANTYHLDMKASRKLKEEFAVSNRKYADQNEKFLAVTEKKEKIEINQYKLAELIETRIVTMLKNVKFELNNLTNREIGYIIITGGITSMLGFSAIVEDLFPKNSTVMNLGVIGIRDNKFSNAYGLIKYFIEKLELREKEYTMFSEEKVEEMMATRKKVGASSVIGKIFDRIFD